MKFNKWTMALVATGVVSLASAVNADEHPVNTLLSSTTLSGYVDTSAIWNFGSGNGVANRFVNTAPDRQDGFNLNVAKVALERPLDEGSWSAGYKLETLFGPDAVGLPGNSGTIGANNVGLKQAYVALRAPIGNGVDFKVGRFDPIIGYEVFDSYANPTFSRSFGFAIEPFIHTGVLATYQFTDMIGASAGIANTDQSPVARSFGVDPDGTFVAVGETKKTYMAGLVLKAPDSTGWMAGSSLYSGAVVGMDRFLGTGTDQDLNLYVGGSLATPIKGFTVGASYDYLDGDSFANAVALYASFQATEQLKLNVRGEYANSGYGAFAGYGVSESAGTSDKITSITATADYALWANVVTRVEFRYDHSANGEDAFYNNGGLDEDVPGSSGGAGGDRNDVSLLLNVIYKF